MTKFGLPLVLLVAGVVALLVAGQMGSTPADQRVRLVTTTSTENSGLLSYLLEPWSEKTGIEVNVLAVGTGKALAIGTRGDADLVLVHARTREDAFIASGNGVDRRDVMWNDFVVAGPPADPAGIRGMSDAPLALAKIALARADFISRGDDSGTHIREVSLWKASRIDPEGKSFYIKAGQGMGKCLTIADQRSGYVLTDRGTYLAVREGKQLEVLVEGDEALRNPYGAMLVNPEKHPHAQHANALKLLDYLTSPEGQERIGAFRKDGEVLFHPVGAK